MFMKNLFSNKYVQIGISFFVVFIILSFSAKKIKDYKKSLIQGKSRKKENNTANLTRERGFYKSFSLRLKNSMTGLGGSERDRAMAQMLTFNDDEITEIYNQFNKIIDPPETLRDWVNGEYMPFFFFF